MSSTTVKSSRGRSMSTSKKKKPVRRNATRTSSTETSPVRAVPSDASDSSSAETGGRKPDLASHARAVRNASRSMVGRTGIRVLSYAIGGVLTFFVMMVMATIIVPLTGILVAKETGVTTSSSGMDLVGLWVMPMATVLAMFIAAEFWLLRKMWRSIIARARGEHDAAVAR